MIRAVLDANVLAAGAVGDATRAPGAILRRWIDGRFVLVTSAAIRDEVRRTLEKPYFRARISAFDRLAFMTAIDGEAEFVEPTVRIEGVATHPEDDRVLEAAVSATVDYLVTGDRGLQRLGEYAGIPILDPRAFAAILAAQPPD